MGFIQSIDDYTDVVDAIYAHRGIVHGSATFRHHLPDRRAVSKGVVFVESEAEWTDRGRGLRTWYLVTSELGASTFLTGITEFDEDAELPFHWHNCDESVIVLEGSAAFETGDREVMLTPAGSTWVPSGVVHRFRNAGSARLRILWIYGSIDATRTLLSTGETVEVGTAADRHWS